MKFRNAILGLCIALVTCVALVRAQDQRQDTQQSNSTGQAAPANSGLGGGYAKPPVGAGRGASPPSDPQTYDPSQVSPDQNTLAGAELFGVGSLQHTRNIFDPAITVSELGESGQGQIVGGVTVPQTLASVTLVGGSLSFNRSWDIFHVVAAYNGGETFNEGIAASHFQYHNLTVAEVADWNRWHIVLSDNFIAEPGAAFSGAGMGGPGLAAQFSSLLGASLNGIAQSFTPAQSIDTGNAMRYMNDVVGQASYSFTRRSALTVSASYGILDFSGAGFVSSNMFNTQAGYDYMLDRNNSIAILGSYGRIDYTGTAGSTTNYMGALAYGRRITGRLAFQVGSGPQHIESINTGSLTGNFQFWLWSANSAMIYDRRRSGIVLNFSRGLTAGSGVFLGAVSNTFTGTAHYQFTRNLLGAVSGGYAVNNSLTVPGGSSVRFDDWFMGATIGRPLGRHTQINFNYGLGKQRIPAVCPVTSCGVPGFQQTFGMTVNWHLRRSG